MLKEITIETIHAINDKELGFLRNLGLDEKFEYIFFIEPMRKKNRQELPEGAIEGIQDEISQIKSENKQSKVISFVQFIKGSKRTLDKVERAMRCSMFDGSDGVCIYETFPKQSYEDFSEELDGFLEVSGDAEKYLVLEIDGNQVREKLLIAFSKGLKNIIFVAGAYKDNDLWIDLIEKIRKENGKSFVVFLKRMHSFTKEAYIVKAITIGSNVIVHGSFTGRNSEEKKNYYLDRSDGKYKLKTFLPETSVLYTNENLKKLSKSFNNNSDEETALSRVCSLIEGKSLCMEKRRKITLNTEN